MSDILFQPGSPKLIDLIGNGRSLQVPRYQRDYSWEEEEWDDLWHDIIGIKEEGIHYMGYVVLQQTSDSRTFVIIDGQQRIATLSILALAVLQLLDDWVKEGVDSKQNAERIEILRNDFIGFTSATSLIPSSKLSLNRNNDDFYKSYLVRLRKPQNISKLKPSEKKLWRAFVFFYDKLRAKYNSQKSGEQLSAFLEETVARKLQFTSITVGDELNAYKVFETLNARGVKLSTGDLVKNYLFSEVAKYSEHDLDEAERQWQKINDILQKIELPTFLRHYWNAKYPLVRKNSLFKALRGKIKSSEAVFDLLNEMEALAEVYVSLDTPSSELWNVEQSKMIEELSFFNVSQCYSLLMAAYKNIKSKNEQEFNKILKDLIVVIFRYNTISGFNPNIQEDVFNRAANNIFNSTAGSAKEVFQILKEIYVDDGKFENLFIYKALNTNRYKALSKYILVKLEQQISGLPLDWSDSKITIEHILPENPPNEWEEFFSTEIQQECIFRLGNLTLLEAKKNKECGTKLFNEKKEIYETSSYRLSNDYTSYSEWNPTILLQRQKKLAALAKTTWKIQH